MSQVDNNYDPFEEEEAINDSYARPRSLDTLTPGEPYRIIKLFAQNSKFAENGVFPIKTIAQYKENGLKFQSILPKKHNNKGDKWFEAMNKLIETNHGPKLVYYGKTGQSFEYDLLRHTQDVDMKKLETVQTIMSRTTNNLMSPVKRPSNSTENTPEKRRNIESDVASTSN